jgi:hypothetical protein
MKFSRKTFVLTALLITLTISFQYFCMNENQRFFEPIPNKVEQPVTLEPTPFNIEATLMRLGIPTGTVDGIWDERTRQGFCVWRELSGYEANRNFPTNSEKNEIVHTLKVQPAANNVVGVNVNKTCQTAVWIKDNSRQNFEIFIVSTGMASAHDTDSGDWKISWRLNRWHESTIYPDGWMYWPMYFSYTGAALHGSESDEMVRWYPASHGCVRMLHADIDKLWKANFGVGDNVKVYGKWSYVVNDPVAA